MRWRPDTCDPDINKCCYVEYEGELTPSSIIEFINVCPVHARLQTDHDRAVAIYTENTNKNKAHGALVEAGLAEATNFEGWEFSDLYYHGARKLVISSAGLVDKKKANGAISMVIEMGAFEVQ